MALTTSDGLVTAFAGAHKEAIYKASATSEAAGQIHTYLFSAGRPSAITTPSPGVNGAAVDSSVAGFIPFTDASGGNQKYLGSLDLASSLACYIILADMLWWNSGITVTTTTQQTLTAAAIGSRDSNGSSNGVGVEAGILVSTATTNGSAVTNTTFTYTNSAGTTGKSGTMTSFPTTCVAGTLVPFNLASGDVGVRAIESVTLGTSYGGGAIHLVLFRRLGAISIPTANTSGSRNFLDVGCKMYSGSAPFLMALASGTSAGLVMGTVTLIEG